jgi:predicted dehydrogenase
LGAIGQGYDYSVPLHNDERILTHATAFTLHPDFDLIAGIDSSIETRNRFQEKFKIPAYEKITDITGPYPDLIVISTPTNTRLSIFEECLRLKPKLIFLEKPIAATLAEARQIMKLAEEKQCSLCVNFTRRFDPSTIALRANIVNGRYGKIRKGVVWYAKGLLNNGSHFIDLCRYLLGEVSSAQIIQPGRDLHHHDAEPDFMLKFGDCEVFFLAGYEEDFSLKEITLLTEKGMLHYGQGGERIQFFGADESSLFHGYKVLNKESEDIYSSHQRNQWHVANQISKYLSGQEPLLSNSHSALKTQELVDQLFNLRQNSISR